MADEIADAMTDNEALRRLLGEFRAYREEQAEEYDEVSEVTDIAADQNSAGTTARAADESAVKTVVINRGSDRCYVYEDGQIVASVGSNSDDVLPLRGKGVISVAAGIGDSTTVDITTFRRGA